MSDDFSENKFTERFNLKKDLQDDSEIDEELAQSSDYQSNCEDKCESIFIEIKDYTEQISIPLVEKLNIGHLIDWLFPDLQRLY